MSQIKCQYADHLEQKCAYICIETACSKKRVACFLCFQDQNYHLNHNGITIEQFHQKVDQRLSNLKQFLVILEESKDQFNNFISTYQELVKNHIIEGKRYQEIENLNKIETIQEYYTYEQDNITPFVQKQLEKFQKKIDKINKFIVKFQYKVNKIEMAEEINGIKKRAMQIIKNKIGNNYYEDAIKQLDQGLKKDPTNCSLISLKCICLTNINKFEKAKKLIDYAFQINQNDETVLLFQIKLMMKEKNYWKCLEYYDLSIETNQYLAFFKLDSLEKLNQREKFEVFKQECQKLFGNEFNQKYDKHKEMQQQT